MGGVMERMGMGTYGGSGAWGGVGWCWGQSGGSVQDENADGAPADEIGAWCVWVLVPVVEVVVRDVPPTQNNTTCSATKKDVLEINVLTFAPQTHNHPPSEPYSTNYTHS